MFVDGTTVLASHISYIYHKANDFKFDIIYLNKIQRCPRTNQNAMVPSGDHYFVFVSLYPIPTKLESLNYSNTKLKPLSIKGQESK
jgi:hypothetical protein